MSLKVPWVASLACSTEWTTQWAAYLNIFNGNERKMIVNLKKNTRKNIPIGDIKMDSE